MPYAHHDAGGMLRGSSKQAGQQDLSRRELSYNSSSCVLLFMLYASCCDGVLALFRPITELEFLLVNGGR